MTVSASLSFRTVFHSHELSSLELPVEVRTRTERRSQRYLPAGSRTPCVGGHYGIISTGASVAVGSIAFGGAHEQSLHLLYRKVGDKPSIAVNCLQECRIALQ